MIPFPHKPNIFQSDCVSFFRFCRIWHFATAAQVVVTNCSTQSRLSAGHWNWRLNINTNLHLIYLWSGREIIDWPADKSQAAPAKKLIDQDFLWWWRNRKELMAGFVSKQNLRLAFNIEILKLRKSVFISPEVCWWRCGRRDWCLRPSLYCGGRRGGSRCVRRCRHWWRDCRTSSSSAAHRSHTRQVSQVSRYSHIAGRLQSAPSIVYLCSHSYIQQVRMSRWCSPWAWTGGAPMSCPNRWRRPRPTTTPVTSPAPPSESTSRRSSQRSLLTSWDIKV